MSISGYSRFDNGARSTSGIAHVTVIYQAQWRVLQPVTPVAVDAQWAVRQQVLVMVSAVWATRTGTGTGAATPTGAVIDHYEGLTVVAAPIGAFAGT